MMNYEIFKEVVKEKFMDYMPEKFKGMELVAEPVEKVNVTLDGIILREKAGTFRLRFISMTCIRSIRTVVILRKHLWRHVTSWKGHMSRLRLLMWTAL